MCSFLEHCVCVHRFTHSQPCLLWWLFWHSIPRPLSSSLFQEHRTYYLNCSMNLLMNRNHLSSVVLAISHSHFQFGCRTSELSELKCCSFWSLPPSVLTVSGPNICGDSHQVCPGQGCGQVCMNLKPYGRIIEWQCSFSLSLSLSTDSRSLVNNTPIRVVISLLSRSL